MASTGITLEFFADKRVLKDEGLIVVKIDLVDIVDWVIVEQNL